MGYNTDWSGSLELNRKLTRAEQQEWDDVVENRHDSEYGYGDPKREYPSIWCNFEVEGDEFMWNGNEKTYEGYGWIIFFLKWTKQKSKDNLLYATGEMTFKGEDESDIGRVTVVYYEDNKQYGVEEHIAEIEYRYFQNDKQHFKRGGKLKVGFEDGFYKFNIGWFWNRNEEFIMEALNKIKNESKPGTYDEITDSKWVYDDVKGPFKNIIKDVQQTVDIVFQVTQRGIPVVGLRIKLNYTHKQGGSNGYSLSYVYILEGPRKNRWVDPTKSYSEVEEFKKGGTLKVKGRSWYEAGGMVKQAEKMRRFKNEMDQSIRQSKGEIEESKRNIEKNRQNLIDSADNIKREERSIKENIVGMREDAKEAQEFERRARKYAKGGKIKKRMWLAKEGKEEFVLEAPNKKEAEEDASMYGGYIVREIKNFKENPDGSVEYAKGGDIDYSNIKIIKKWIDISEVSVVIDLLINGSEHRIAGNKNVNDGFWAIELTMDGEDFYEKCEEYGYDSEELEDFINKTIDDKIFPENELYAKGGKIVFVGDMPLDIDGREELTKEEAERLAKEWKEKGYDDVIIEDYAKGGRTYSRENRPSPSSSATLFEPGYRSRGNDGNIWEIRENIKGTHRWVKLKG